MFDLSDYKDVLQAKLEAHEKQRGYQKRLAEAAGCHTSFISQVARGSVHLTPDHAAGLCAFWGFDPDETDFFLTLVHLARASSPKLRRVLERRLGELRDKRRSIARRVGQKSGRETDPSAAAQYYATWHMAALHVLLGVPGFDTAEALAHRLRLPLPFVTGALERLAAIGLVTGEQGRWRVAVHDLHLPAASPFIQQHHANWRQYALLHMAEHGGAATHYTSLLGISRADFERLREKVLHLVVESRALALASPEEDLFCFSLDLFPV